jgi:hypothetical protein
MWYIEAMNEQPQNGPAPRQGMGGSSREGTDRVAPRLGRRLLVSASLAAPTLLTLGRAAHSQTANKSNQTTKKKGKSMGTASQLASIKKRKG